MYHLDFIYTCKLYKNPTTFLAEHRTSSSIKVDQEIQQLLMTQKYMKAGINLFTPGLPCSAQSVRLAT